MSDDQAREMRPETTSEHIARDMREGRFPEQSERQMVPVLASLPHEIQVWRSMDALDHTGTWSTTRYPAEAVTYVSKADAQAAVARAYEAAAERLDLAEHDAEERDWRSGANAFAALAKGLRALAPADGLAAVKALRAEIADLKMNMDADLRTMVREGQQLRTLAAELAAAQQREAELLAALEDPLVVHLNMVAGKIAKPLPSQLAHIYGEDVIRAALAQTPTDPGDGWTWNERLGWIGPDGKPADPRRRG